MCYLQMLIIYKDLRTQSSSYWEQTKQFASDHRKIIAATLAGVAIASMVFSNRSFVFSLFQKSPGDPSTFVGEDAKRFHQAMDRECERIAINYRGVNPQDLVKEKTDSDLNPQGPAIACYSVLKQAACSSREPIKNYMDDPTRTINGGDRPWQPIYAKKVDFEPYIQSALVEYFKNLEHPHDPSRVEIRSSLTCENVSDW